MPQQVRLARHQRQSWQPTVHADSIKQWHVAGWHSLYMGQAYCWKTVGLRAAVSLVLVGFSRPASSRRAYCCAAAERPPFLSQD
jgi:hypothetical protein